MSWYEFNPAEVFAGFTVIGVSAGLVVGILDNSISHALSVIGDVMTIYCALCCVEIIRSLRNE